jgi:hypothetical protein
MAPQTPAVVMDKYVHSLYESHEQCANNVFFLAELVIQNSVRIARTISVRVHAYTLLQDSLAMIRLPSSSQQQSQQKVQSQVEEAQVQGGRQWRISLHS